MGAIHKHGVGGIEHQHRHRIYTYVREVIFHFEVDAQRVFVFLLTGGVRHCLLSPAHCQSHHEDECQDNSFHEYIIIIKDFKDLKGFSISSRSTLHFSLFTLHSSLFPSPSEEGGCEATAKLQHFYSVTFTFIVKKDKHCKNCQII